eukprot:TRINITY_DN14619_c0_g1_i1.p1 TRINITY_DN14619_c0_g1~~TRINITY_DN14619_c0_g1_i1.p1  ORF type:complete len:447 (+),score=212.43 TRINITY_DN14619_c0_g1_i1:96-1343(+)
MAQTQERDWLVQNGVPDLVDALVAAMLDARPSDPEGFAIQWFRARTAKPEPPIGGGLMKDLGLRPGVLVGEEVTNLLRYAKDHVFAIPAFNVTSSSVANCVMEAAAKSKSPVMIQISNGGGVFYAGKSLPNKGEFACIQGTIAAARHVHSLAKHYGIPVVLHTDHCAKKLLPWVDGCLDANEEHYREHGQPLFSSHMLDLSVETVPYNISTCEKYLTRMAKMGITLEMEIGLTGGEEDGVDHSGAAKEDLYTRAEDVYSVHETLSKVSHRFTIAAAFGNVHGVYKPGNVQLRPELLGEFQKYVKDRTGCKEDKPLFLVFHGGSGSEKEKIQEAIRNGVVKMNVDTDTQWAYWEGLLNFYKKSEGYLQGQLGNPEGADKPNKKFYDPRVWLRKCEESMCQRVIEAFTDLGCLGKLE